MVDAVLLFLFLWIAAEQRKMRPDPGPKFDPSKGWSKKVRPLVIPRDLSAFVTVTGKLGFRSEKVTLPRGSRWQDQNQGLAARAFYQDEC